MGRSLKAFIMECADRLRHNYLLFVMDRKHGTEAPPAGPLRYSPELWKFLLIYGRCRIQVNATQSICNDLHRHSAGGVFLPISFCNQMTYPTSSGAKPGPGRKTAAGIGRGIGFPPF